MHQSIEIETLQWLASNIGSQLGQFARAAGRLLESVGARVDSDGVGGLCVMLDIPIIGYCIVQTLVLFVCLF